MKVYRVIIPYLHEFHVEAENEEEAKQKAISEGHGKILCREDNRIEVETE